MSKGLKTLSKVFDKLLHRDIDDLLGEVKKEYTRVRDSEERLRQKLANWNKDEELEQLREQAELYRKHSLRQCSDKELDAINQFRARHIERCGNNNQYQFTLTGTEVGTAIDIRCPICGEELDVTDYSTW